MFNIHLLNYHHACKNNAASSYPANIRCLDTVSETFFKNTLLVLFALVAMQVTHLALAYRALLPIPVTHLSHVRHDGNAIALQKINHQPWQQLLQRYLIEVDDINDSLKLTNNKKNSKTAQLEQLPVKTTPVKATPVNTIQVKKIPVKTIRRFDYAAVSLADQAMLHHYISTLEATKISQYSRDEQLAFWVNLYNALTVQLIVKHYPVTSIKDIGNMITGPWNDEITRVAGMPLTLNQIEHGIIRANWQDSRVHYVLNCASIGCPDLPKRPLLADHIEQQLEQAARAFVNQKKAVHFTQEQLVLSKIYQWFSDDFGADFVDNRDALIAHLAQYAQPQLKKKLLNFKGDIRYQYNWQLNHPNTSEDDVND